MTLQIMTYTVVVSLKSNTAVDLAKNFSPMNKKEYD